MSLIVINVTGDAHEEKSEVTSTTSVEAVSPTKSSGTTVNVRCVVCSSDPDDEGEACVTRPQDFVKDCVNPVNSQFGNYTGCRKIEQWVDYDQNISDPNLSNHHRVIRQCAFFGMKKPCMHSANLGGKQYVCFCQGDGCNSSLIPGYSIITSGACFLIFLFGFRLTQIPSHSWLLISRGYRLCNPAGNKLHRTCVPYVGTS